MCSSNQSRFYELQISTHCRTPNVSHSIVTKGHNKECIGPRKTYLTRRWMLNCENVCKVRFPISLSHKHCLRHQLLPQVSSSVGDMWLLCRSEIRMCCLLVQVVNTHANAVLFCSERLKQTRKSKWISANGVRATAFRPNEEVRTGRMGNCVGLRCNLVIVCYVPGFSHFVDGRSGRSPLNTGISCVGLMF